MWNWLARRPFLASLFVIMVVAGPGYWRQERAIDEAHSAAVDAEVAAAQAQKTATALSQLLVQIEQDRRDRRFELCQRDVADRVDDRAMWEAAFVLFEGAPEVADLRVTMDALLPLLECGADGAPHPRD